MKLLQRITIWGLLVGWGGGSSGAAEPFAVPAKPKPPLLVLQVTNCSTPVLRKLADRPVATAGR